MREKKEISLGKVISNVIFYVVMAFLIFVCVTMINAKRSGKQPSVFGNKFYIVLTGSMTPTIYPGDLIVVKDVDKSSIEVGDIITFASSGSDNITTHRVKEILNTDEGLKFITQGDANNVEDSPVKSDLVLGKVTKNFPKLGAKVQYVQDNIVKIIIAILIFGLVIAMWTSILRKNK